MIYPTRSYLFHCVWNWIYIKYVHILQMQGHMKKSSHVFLLQIFFNALLTKVFSTFPVFDSTDTLSIVVIAFQYGFASMIFDEVIRNCRSIQNWNWTNNFLSFPERMRKKFAEVYKIFLVGQILSGRSEKGKQTIF